MVALVVQVPRRRTKQKRPVPWALCEFCRALLHTEWRSPNGDLICGKCVLPFHVLEGPCR